MIPDLEQDQPPTEISSQPRVLSVVPHTQDPSSTATPEPSQVISRLPSSSSTSSLSSKTGNVKRTTASKDIGKGKPNPTSANKSTTISKAESKSSPVTFLITPSVQNPKSKPISTTKSGQTLKPTPNAKLAPTTKSTVVNKSANSNKLGTTPKAGILTPSSGIVSAAAAAMAASAASVKNNAQVKMIKSDSDNEPKGLSGNTDPPTKQETNPSVMLHKTLRASKLEKTTYGLGNFTSVLNSSREDKRTENSESKSKELPTESANSVTSSSTLNTSKISTKAQKPPVTKSNLSSAVAAASAFTRAQQENNSTSSTPNSRLIRKKPVFDSPYTTSSSSSSSLSLSSAPLTAPVPTPVVILGPTELTSSASSQTKPISISRKSTPLSTSGFSTPIPAPKSTPSLKATTNSGLVRANSTRSLASKASISNEVPVSRLNPSDHIVSNSHSDVALGKLAGESTSTSPYRSHLSSNSPQSAKHTDITLRVKNRQSTQHSSLPSNLTTGLSGGAQAGAMAAALAAKDHAKELTNRIEAGIVANKEKLSRNPGFLTKVKAEVDSLRHNHLMIGTDSNSSSSNNRLKIPGSPTKGSPRSSLDSGTSMNIQRPYSTPVSQIDSEHLEALSNVLHTPVRTSPNVVVKSAESSSRLDSASSPRKVMKVSKGSLLPPAELDNSRSNIDNASLIQKPKELAISKPKTSSSGTQLADSVNDKTINFIQQPAVVNSYNPYKNGNPYNTDCNFMSMDINSRARPLSISGYPSPSLTSSTDELNRSESTLDTFNNDGIDPYAYSAINDSSRRKSLLGGLFNYAFQPQDSDETAEDEEMTKLKRPLTRKTTIGEYDPNEPSQLYESSKGVISIPEFNNNIINNLLVAPKKSLGKRGMMKYLLSGGHHKNPKTGGSHHTLIRNEKETQIGSTPPRIPIKTTMRKTTRHKSFNADKPWKHHVDAVILTDTERKRYEGLWAANKGVHLEFMNNEDNMSEDEEEDDDDETHHEADDSEDAYLTRIITATPDISKTNLDSSKNNVVAEIDPKDCIHGYIIRQIWSRSRLSDDTLSQIWELVDRVKDGTLDREGFLVGTWLVDQCLYGRKLPTKVDENVWRSVGRMNVRVKIKIQKKKKNKHKKIGGKIPELDI